MARTSPKNTASKGSKASRKISNTTGSRKVARSSVSGKMLVVSRRGDGWGVRRVGSNQARVFDTKVDAVKAATKTARDSKSGVIIKGMDGKIKQVSTSSADSLMLDVWKSARQDKGSPKKPKGGAGSHSKKA